MACGLRRLSGVDMLKFIRLGRVARSIVSGLLLLAADAGSLPARDAFVLLSGGDTEMENNYSQYLQARAMAEFFDKSYPRESVWIFFGAGNVEGEKPVFSDVYRQVKHGDEMVDTWLPGALPHNRPARREEFLPALRREILPTVASGGTLYLFVGDHGTWSGGRNGESVIVLWGVYRDEVSEHGWRESGDETLGVTELRRELMTGLGRGRVVFCMTQCHAGGFHYLAIPHEMTPEASWFTALPRWARRRPGTVFPAVAGFAATDEFSLASGCNPSPDPDVWAGYERYFPESLLGQNLFTQEQTGEGMRSFCDAHAAAVMTDRTIDKPRSTSDQYLERWAGLIETRLARESHLTPRLMNAVAEYQRTVNGQVPKVPDAAFRERQAQFDGFIEKLAVQNDAEVLRTGTRAELEQVIKQMPPDTDTDEAPSPREKKLWNQTIRPAWKAAVEAGRATNLPAAAAEFERFLLGQEDRGVDFFFGDDDMRNDVFWQAGYGNPQSLNPARAEAIGLWAQERKDKILDWARDSENAAVRNAGERLAQMVAEPDTDAGEADKEDRMAMKATAAERTLFYRRALGAWQFLIAVNDRPALARLKELIELERTPLPRPK
jgi:hypothetical protein